MRQLQEIKQNYLCATVTTFLFSNKKNNFGRDVFESKSENQCFVSHDCLEN